VKGVVPLDGRGPNPLLQNHPLMAFHPPMLYLGYVGFTIPSRPWTRATAAGHTAIMSAIAKHGEEQAAKDKAMEVEIEEIESDLTTPATPPESD
jgi:hypothetical protein